MTNRDRIWRRACNWVRGWNGGKCTPTAEIAYLAGWQAAMREVKKRASSGKTVTTHEGKS